MQLTKNLLEKEVDQIQVFKDVHRRKVKKTQNKEPLALSIFDFAKAVKQGFVDQRPAVVFSRSTRSAAKENQVHERRIRRRRTNNQI